MLKLILTFICGAFFGALALAVLAVVLIGDEDHGD